VSRFTEVKRLGLLVRSFVRAREALQEAGATASLVLLGGYPGEWEGEHPYDTIRATGARDVYLAGWHEHDALPDFFAASDAVVLSSVREQFGSALVEGMACGLPAVAVDRFGPADIVRPGRTGWLVEPDDEDALAGALAQAIDHPEERRRRGDAARRDVTLRFAWPALADRLSQLFAQVAEADDDAAVVAAR
jgi:glycosyltransferase involved in cell wall biosynthesis